MRALHPCGQQLVPELPRLRLILVPPGRRSTAWTCRYRGTSPASHLRTCCWRVADAIAYQNKHFREFNITPHPAQPHNSSETRRAAGQHRACLGTLSCHCGMQLADPSLLLTILGLPAKRLSWCGAGGGAPAAAVIDAQPHSTTHNLLLQGVRRRRTAVQLGHQQQGSRQHTQGALHARTLRGRFAGAAATASTHTPSL